MFSRFNDKRIPLFRFQIQDEIFRFAQADRVVTAGGFDWLPAPIERDSIRRNNERAQQNLKIRMAYLRDPNAPIDDLPATQDLGDLWHPYIPSSPVQVMCLSHQHGSLDAPTYDWSGFVAQPRFNDVELELTCVPSNFRAEARNQGAKFQRACFKVVYSTGLRGCNLDPVPFTLPATLTGVTGLTLTSPAFATAPLSLLQGWFYWTRSNGRKERRTIIYHVGDTIRLLYGGHELANGLEATVQPNCEGNWDACAARRDDPELHYGGAIYEPIKNPMQGVSMSWGG